MKKTIGETINELNMSRMGTVPYNRLTTMTLNTRKFVLTLHIIFSVGWLGAIMAYLALAIAGLTSQDVQIVKVVYPSLALVGWYIIVPNSVAALLTGVILSLGTQWGLFRYYWVFIKFLLSFVASVVLINHMPVVSSMAIRVIDGKLSGPDFEKLRVQLLVHATGGLLILVTTAVLSVYKPWGKTGYGLSKHQRQAHQRRKLYILLGLTGLITLFIILHIVSGGMHVHH